MWGGGRSTTASRKSRVNRLCATLLQSYDEVTVCNYTRTWSVTLGARGRLVWRRDEEAEAFNARP